MSDPRRLREERPDDIASILLGHARSDEPPPRFRGSLLAGLGLGAGTAAGSGIGSAATMASAGKAAAASPTGLLFGKGYLVTGIAILAVGAGLVWQMASANRTEPVAALRAVGRPAKIALTGALAPRSPELERQLGESSSVGPPGEPSAPTFPGGRPGRPAAAADRNSPPRLSDEVAALDEARRSLAADDSKEALARLKQFERKFPSARLGSEAAVLRIEALIAKGDLLAARKLAERHLATEPDGPHARRVESLLARIKTRQSTER